MLRIDADERMTPTLAARLRSLMVQPNVCSVQFARRNFLFGDWLRHGGWFRSDQTRFFRSDSWDRSWTADPHTQVPVRGESVSLPATPELSTLHYDYVSVVQFVRRTLAGYALAEAQIAVRNGEQFRSWRLLWRPLRMFLGRYLVRKGFLDGTRGLVAATMLASYELCKQAMIWDLTR